MVFSRKIQDRDVVDDIRPTVASHGQVRCCFVKTSSPGRSHWLSGIFTVFLFLMTDVLSAVNPTYRNGQQPSETNSPDETKPGPSVELVVRGTEFRLDIGANRTQHLLRTQIHVSATNTGTRPVRIQGAQFELLSDQAPVQVSSSDYPPFPEDTILSPSATAEGWLAYSGLLFTGAEPELELRWPPGNIQVQLNPLIRDSCEFKSTRLGPENGLVRLELSRSLDVFSALVYRDSFGAFFRSGAERLILVPEADTEGKTRRLQVSDEFLLWLSAMQESAVNSSPGPPIPLADVKFRHLSVAGFSISSHYIGTARRTVPVLQSEDDAIFAALVPVYRFASLDQALSDLKSPIAGIRRAAMAGAADRLTPEQARILLDQAISGPPESRSAVASYLHLVPGPGTVQVLQQLVRDPHQETSAIALRSLVSCQDALVPGAISTLWNEGDAEFRARLLQSVVESGQERWLPLMKQSLTEVLLAETALSGTSRTSVAGVLSLLKLQKDSELTPLLRKQVKELSDPALQDLVAAFLIETDPDHVLTWIQQFAEQRIRSKNVTSAVVDAVIMAPERKWGEFLLERLLTTDTEDQSRLLQAALACAGPAELRRLKQQADQLPPEIGVQLLTHLAAISDPEWYELARKLLRRPGAPTSAVLSALSEDGSDQAIEVLCSQLTQYVRELESTKDASAEGKPLLAVMMLTVARLAHPECRRTMNRLSIDPNDYVRDTATQYATELYRRSVSLTLMLQEERPLREKGEVAEADKVVDRCIEIDPFLAENYSHRASERMHAGRFEESMADLMIARRLSPEDPDVESLIAIVLVRLGRIDEGLSAAESLVQAAPKSWVALYNGACVWSRAAEHSATSAENRRKYADRAIELLTATSKLQFSDHQHLNKDEDLIQLHSHPQWNEVVAAVRANDPEAAAVPQP